MGETEFDVFKEPPLTHRGKTIDLETATSQELIDAGKRLSYPFLIHRGLERQAVEEAQSILNEQTNPKPETEEQ